MGIVEVAVDVPVSTLFDYRLDGATRADVGLLVLVPFGRRQVVGLIMGIKENSAVSPQRVRAVVRVLRDVPALSAELLDLVRFCSAYYHHPLGEVALSALPSRLRSSQRAPPRRAYDYVATALGRAEALATPLTRAGGTRTVWGRCEAGSGVLSHAASRSLTLAERRALKRLIARGWIEPRPASACALRPAPQTPAAAPELSADQRRAVQSIASGHGYRTWLLHGITGSGKTEVYFRLFDDALRDDGQVLLLVPEINLTPQLEGLIGARFPHAAMVSLHSGLGARERAENWLRAQAGDARIIVGTRSAVFAPLPRLRLIVVDEEHDSSFKQFDGMRYHARDVAVWRARYHRVPIVLGSATPSLETYHHALTSRYAVAALPARANDRALPDIRLVPTRGRRITDGIAPEVVEALRVRIGRGEQCLVFINRRGYAPVLLCHACHWVAGCRRCSSHLVLHAARRRLVCHHCGHAQPVLASCPDCGNVDLRPLGHGTQRIEAVLREALPGARLLRVDRDSTGPRDAWSDMRSRIERREIDILVGTQIMAKGHDFPGLSLVCVLDADRSLFSTDFRASEQLFAQLMQVAGRAGRGDAAGVVLIQTEFPDHPLYQSLCRHDFARFAEQLLRERKRAAFPPFVYQALLRAEAPGAERVFDFLGFAAHAGKALGEDIALFDPVPCVLQRLRGLERGQLLVQCGSRPRLQRFLDAWIAALRARDGKHVRWSIDVDPLEV